MRPMGLDEALCDDTLLRSRDDLSLYSDGIGDRSDGDGAFKRLWHSQKKWAFTKSGHSQKSGQNEPLSHLGKEEHVLREELLKVGTLPFRSSPRALQPPHDAPQCKRIHPCLPLHRCTSLHSTSQQRLDDSRRSVLACLPLPMHVCLAELSEGNPHLPPTKTALDRARRSSLALLPPSAQRTPPRLSSCRLLLQSMAQFELFLTRCSASCDDVFIE